VLLAAIGLVLYIVGVWFALREMKTLIGSDPSERSVCAFAWISQMLQTKWFPETSNERVVIERSWSWVVTANIFAFLHIFVLGPGVGF